MRTHMAIVAAFCAAAAFQAEAQTVTDEEQQMASETKDQRDARMAWWREARFGMFIHWGLYAVPAGTWNGEQIPGIGEWIMHRAEIPAKDYAALAEQFHPVQYDADAWVRLAKEAGMKYIVITSKHHDGFAMFCSEASTYDICDATPFKRDPLKELAAACQEHGIKLGFYYSQAQDWHHPGGAAAGGHWDRAQEGDMTQYIRTIAVPQVREILSNYGPIAILWWDTPVDMTKERAEILLPLLDLQPGIITNNRLGGGYEGDTETPEQFVPPTGYPERDWETCMTINDTWGYKSYDNNWKSTETLIRHLVDIASKGGNFLLNVGPTAKGLIPEPSIERLKEIGQWMKVNGEAIYGTSASPFRRLAWGRCTQKDGRLYLHVFEWPQDGTLRVPMKNAVTRAYLLTDASTPLPVVSSGDGTTIEAPAMAPDPIATVVVVEVEGAVEALPVSIEQDTEGAAVLSATDAEIVGSRARLEGHQELNIGFWTDAADYVTWNLLIVRPGTFRVDVEYACDPGSPGSTYAVAVDGQEAAGEVRATAGWQDYRKERVGRLHIDTPGTYTVTLKPTRKPGAAVMNLRSVTLQPES